MIQLDLKRFLLNLTYEEIQYLNQFYLDNPITYLLLTSSEYTQEELGTLINIFVKDVSNNKLNENVGSKIIAALTELK
jgi:hypothetical protein